MSTREAYMTFASALILDVSVLGGAPVGIPRRDVVPSDIKERAKRQLETCRAYSINIISV